VFSKEKKRKSALANAPLLLYTPKAKPNPKQDLDDDVSGILGAGDSNRDDSKDLSLSQQPCVFREQAFPVLYLSGM